MNIDDLERWPRELPNLRRPVVVVRHDPHAIATAMDTVEVMAEPTVGISIPSMLAKRDIADQRPIGGISGEPLASGIDDQQTIFHPLDLMPEKQPPGSATKHGAVVGVARHFAAIGIDELLMRK